MDGKGRSRAFLVGFFALQLFISAVPLAPAAPSGASRTPSYEESWWDDYHATADVYDLVQTIGREHSDIVKLFTIGTTYENRQLLVAKVSDNPNSDEPDEPDVLIIAGTHAREWTTYHGAAYFLNWITGNYRRGSDGALQVAAPGQMDNASLASWLVENREIYILTMVNPDGIEYAHTSDNLWRKNREPNPGVLGRLCTGTDINRNFDWHWGELQGDSHNPCADDFAGPARAPSEDPLSAWRPGESLPGAFSTAEARAIRDIELSHDFKVALSLHSYSGLVLYPWGYTASPSPDHDDFVRMADVMANQTGYIPQQGYELYKTAGVWDDWSYGATGAYSFTIEMGSEFQPPASDIIAQAKLIFGPELYLATIADDLHLTAPEVSVANEATAEVEPNSPVGVTARVDAINGVESASVVFSKDGGRTWSEAPMAQQGSEPVFSGNIPGLRPGASVIYYVRVTDGDGIVRSGPMPAPFQAYEIHARNGILDQIGMFGLVAILGGIGLAGALFYVKFLRGRPMPSLPKLAALPRLPRRKAPKPAAVAGRPMSEAEFGTAVAERPGLKEFLERGR